VPRRLIELSHQIRHGMVTYPGLPGPETSDYHFEGCWQYGREGPGGRESAWVSGGNHARDSRAELTAVVECLLFGLLA
jgi:kynurenine formamidase